MTAIGLVPAAGQATRLGSPTTSKELLSVWRPSDSSEPLPVIRCLLSCLEAAGVTRTVIALRAGKGDIREALGASLERDVPLEYVDVGETPSPPFTLARALEAHADSNFVMGFPDLLFDAPDAGGELLAALSSAAEPDLVLGLFPHPRSRRADIVEVSPEGRVTSVIREGDRSAETWTWGLAAWTPRFSRFLSASVDAFAAGPSPSGELEIADVIRKAIEDGLRVEGRIVSSRPFLDVGTPEGLRKALGDRAAPGPDD